MDIIKLGENINVSFSAKNEEDLKNYLPENDAVKRRRLKTYYSKTIQEKARVSAIQLSHWTNTGVIIPATAVKGTGKMHVYDHQNLIEAMICRELSQFSINYGVMREVLDFLRKKRWMFHIGLSYEKEPYHETIIDGKVTGKISSTIRSPIEKQIRIWDFFKLYPQPGMIYLLLWKDSSSIELPKQKPDDYYFYVNTEKIEEITLRCKSSIVITLSNIVSEAGSFYEEG